jgi:hypothetical protein
MTEDEARQLREAWAITGRECKHKTLTLETTDTGYLTGNHVCLKCGVQMEARPKT